MFDVASTDGTNKFLSGSSYNSSTGEGYASIYYSADGETDWQLISAVNNTYPGRTTDFDRHYWMAAVDGKLYALADASNENDEYTLKYWQDGIWTDVITGPTQDVMRTSEANNIETIGQYIIGTNGYPNAGPRIFDTVSGQFIAAKGNNLPTGFSDLYKSESGTLYALASNAVYKTTDGLNWELFETFTPLTTSLSPYVYFTSLAVDETNEQMFFGTSYYTGDIHVLSYASDSGADETDTGKNNNGKGSGDKGSGQENNSGKTNNKNK